MSADARRARRIAEAPCFAARRRGREVRRVDGNPHYRPYRPDGSAKLRPTEAGSKAGSKFPDCCRIRSAPFDYRVKAPDEHRPPRSMNYAAIKEIAMPRKLIVSIQQGE